MPSNDRYAPGRATAQALHTWCSREQTDIAEACKACGVTREATYAWSRGISNPSADSLRRVHELTGYAYEVLMGDTPLELPRMLGRYGR